MTAWRHVRAIGLLPVTATVLVPALILWRGGNIDVGLGLPGAATALPVVAAAALIALGLMLAVSTIRLFATQGAGTLAPWDPTSKLVVAGPYRHVRNPMISGVMAILAGEALLFGSGGLAIWFAAFVAANLIWMPLVEEPGLRRRFGADYDAYAAHVARWLPRIRPWPGE